MNPPTDFPLPADLPVPTDDGAAIHLTGMTMPPILLPATSGGTINLANLGAGRTVIYLYPMSGVPGKPLPAGWNLIPGARGCTPQACGFRDHHQELLELGVTVFGLSTQSTEYQSELVARVHLPFTILSDAEFKFCEALCLPTFEVEGRKLLKRLTLVIRDQRIEHVFYPVFPSSENAPEVLRWLRVQKG